MITYKKVKSPEIEKDIYPVALTEKTMEKRMSSVLKRMKEKDLDSILIYADLEHGGNFEYLCGFTPRFEESLLVLHASGEAYMFLGNENLNKASKSRISVTPIHFPHLSLPNQPMFEQLSVKDVLKQGNIKEKSKIGMVGWKLLTGKNDNTSNHYDIPHFIIEGLKEAFPTSVLVNATGIFIGEDGVRRINNANEIAHYEYGAAIAGNCILETMNNIEVGKSEIEVASHLSYGGQYHNVVSILASGERYIKANMYPSAKKIELGDTLSITTGFKGGLQSRAGYVVNKESEIPEPYQNYIARLAKPYFNTVVHWVQTLKIGETGNNVYQSIEKVFPKDEFGWYLNPGHLCADEEWMASPIYSESEEIIESGMIFQIDIIPSIAGYAGSSCESGIIIADEKLREEIKHEYPALWTRFETRRLYMLNCLGIDLPNYILPSSCATLYYRPLFLNKEYALVKEEANEE